MAEANDWQYICIACGEVVMAGADFAGQCPKCQGWRWLCHWLNKLGDKDSQGDKNTALQPPSGVITIENQVLPLNRITGKGNKPILPQVPGGEKEKVSPGNPQFLHDEGIVPLKELGITESQSHRWQKAGNNHRATPDDLIRELASQGLGCKAISAKLAKQGIIVSHMTIHRRLQGSLL